MKKLKLVIAIAFLFFGLESFAQSFADGIYTTTYGNISWSSELGSEYPNDGIVYGDYREKGTITGRYNNNGTEVKGDFFNGSSEGKFVFMKPYGVDSFSGSGIKKISGYWGYTSDNAYSNDPNNEWNVTGKIAESNKIQNVTNVWSGKWNTTDGNMILVQIGNKITGTYKGVGKVTATYNPSSRILKGTFHNDKTNKTGYIEFYFEGNSFKGKWGWTSAMTEGNWDGTKHLKNNKELSKLVTSSNTNSTTKYIVTAVSISASNTDVYGFFGCKLFKVTQNGRELISSFGNKSADFYNTTENSNKLLSKNQNFSNSPEYFREFILSNSDLNNNQVKFELELYTHLKAKTTGTNLNYNYKKKILRLDQIKIGQIIAISSFANGSTIFGQGGCTLNFKVTKD